MPSWPAASGSLVDEVWSVTAQADAAVRVLPDGCCDLVWTGSELRIAGPDRAARLVELRRGQTLCGVRFMPGSARSVFGVNGVQLTDDALAASAALGADSAARLSASLAVLPQSERPGRLAAWVREEGLSADSRDPAVRAFVAALTVDPSQRIAALARRIGYSERQLRRRVEEEVGLTPKRLARVLRLQRAVALAQSNGGWSLSDTAFAAGFADQAHLGHECVALAGVNATALLAA